MALALLRDAAVEYNSTLARNPLKALELSLENALPISKTSADGPLSICNSISSSAKVISRG